MFGRFQMLGNISTEQFCNLADGCYRFYIMGPDGNIHQVHLYLFGGRKKFRLAKFDLWFSDYNIHAKAGEKFCKEIEPVIAAAGRIPTGTVVMLPHGGGSTLTFSIPRGQEATWLKRAAEYLANPTNLYSIA